ncbi:nucleotidyltransferase [Bacilliculturomica massiliensis]|uniref:nucleotidyltransferase n=1 Tax=Bacilliculturomica massiliensis TaxID=1917867 RepID=UPI0013EF2569|nr:nucleotidyltransferase [Bacilliculturomica massiliensis]
MKVLGIIAEYNPFHNGHKYHLEQAMARSGADCSVCVMSGCFLQRGEPAMWDKRVRAEMAVKNGVDLVLELPFVFACNNAEQFARGGVSILNGLGCVTDLAFGCEDETHELMDAARILASEDAGFRLALAEALDRGLSYAAARTEALAARGFERAGELLSKPNNILAAEYLKQCILTGSTMRPHGIRRADAGYHSTELPEGTKTQASATAIRRELARTGSLESAADYVPEATLEVLRKISPEEQVSAEDLFLPAAMRIRSASEEDLARILAVTEGMENLLKKSVIRADSMESLLEGLKTKRYARTRLQRALVQILMGLTRDDFDTVCSEEIRYGHLLAFSQKGAALLRQIRQSGCARMPVYSNLSRETRTDQREQIMLKYDLLAADLYHLLQGKTIYETSDLVLSPCRV